MIEMSGRRDRHVATAPGRGAVPRGVDRLLHPAGEVVEEETPATRCRASGPVRHAGGLRRRGAALYYFSAATSSARSSVEARPGGSARRVITTLGGSRGATLGDVSGPREGRRLFITLREGRETRSGLYRESTAPEDVPEDLRIFGERSRGASG